MEKLAKIAHFNEWIHIDNFDVEHIEILPTIKIIHCDTRDFHIIPNTAPHDMGLKDKIKYPNSVIKDTEIFKFLKQLYDKLGGKSKWQIIKNPNEQPQNGSWRYKYIRFYRITIDEFIVTDAYGNPIDYKNLLENAIANNKY